MFSSFKNSNLHALSVLRAIPHINARGAVRYVATARQRAPRHPPTARLHSFLLRPQNRKSLSKAAVSTATWTN
jgi:hypothetical protein